MTRNNSNRQHRYTLAEKLNVLDRLEQGDKQTEVEMDTGIPVKTQQRWGKQRKMLYAQNKGTTPAETFEIVEIDGGERHGFISDVPETNTDMNSVQLNNNNRHDTKDTKDMVDTKGTKGTKGTKDTSTTKGIKVMFVDEDTKEVLLTTDAMIFSTPNETIFDGEVEVEVKQPKQTNNPNNTKPESSLVEPTDNPTNTVDTVKEIISNDWVKILVPLGIGAAGWLWKKRSDGAQKDEINW